MLVPFYIPQAKEVEEVQLRLLKRNRSQLRFPRFYSGMGTGMLLKPTRDLSNPVAPEICHANFRAFENLTIEHL